MKFLIILIVFVCTQSFAGNWVKISDTKAPSTVWVKQAKCESVESETCIDITGKSDSRRWEVVGGILVPDNAGNLAADSEDLQKSNDKLLRESKKSDRLTSMAACVTAVNAVTVLTPTQIKDCLNILIKHNFELEIDPADL